MKTLWAVKALPAGALALSVGLAAVGCSDASKLSDCDLQAKIDALGTASADLATVAGSMKAKLVVACSKIAGTTAPASPTDDDVTTACNAASAKIDANLTAAATITVVPGKCEVAAQAQLNCEASCQVDASCKGGDITARCEPGKLSVECSGSCEGSLSCEASANASVECEGACNGTCSGTCEGTCNGTCTGTCSVKNADGSCAGSCTGTCEGTCSASCKGSCKGSCTYEANATAMCDATARCQGTCTGEAKAPKCEAELTPPECQVDADCQAGCSGQASLKAECTPPTVVISGVADADFAATLTANLPTVLEVAAQGELVVDAAGDVVQAAGNLVAEIPSAPTCVAQFTGKLKAQIEGAVEASASVNVSVMASAKVSTSASAN
ncbi:MAG TPA: hypothetical protein VG937_22755 [Polyangiaceae bacterium]|nr:hypothetical protein [Polyangiaceae bacterium]